MAILRRRRGARTRRVWVGFGRTRPTTQPGARFFWLYLEDLPEHPSEEETAVWKAYKVLSSVLANADPRRREDVLHKFADEVNDAKSGAEVEETLRSWAIVRDDGP